MLSRSLLLFAAVFLCGSAIASEAPIQMMVLGAYHFENPGQDTNNIKVDNVLTSTRQKQLDAVARALLAFRPNRVMVEMESNAPQSEVIRYRDFDLKQLTTDSNEIVQLGFRVAKMARLSVVHGIDVQPKSGEEDYFPYQAVQESAAKFGQTVFLTAANAPVAAWVESFESKQRISSIAQLLALVNSQRTLKSVNQPYFSYLSIGDGNTQSGADLNARWYLRNAKIFGKIVQIAKPGDRVLVVYGFGHNYWLRHFATETPGFRFIDPSPFLKKATLK